MELIGITGKKYHGKDTIGNIFKKYGYVQLSFAQPLKDACKIIFHFNDDQLNGDKKEIIDDYWQTTPRSILQFVGTELFRDQLHKVIKFIDKDIWVKSLEKQIELLKLNDKNVKIVVTDVRFNNEIELIKKLNGKIIRVTRNNNFNYFDSHISENEIDNHQVDWDIENNSTIEDLEAQIKFKLNVK